MKIEELVEKYREYFSIKKTLTDESIEKIKDITGGKISSDDLYLLKNLPFGWEDVSIGLYIDENTFPIGYFFDLSKYSEDDGAGPYIREVSALADDYSNVDRVVGVVNPTLSLEKRLVLATCDEGECWMIDYNVEENEISGQIIFFDLVDSAYYVTHKSYKDLLEHMWIEINNPTISI